MTGYEWFLATELHGQGMRLRTEVNALGLVGFTDPSYTDHIPLRCKWRWTTHQKPKLQATQVKENCRGLPQSLPSSCLVSRAVRMSSWLGSCCLLSLWCIHSFQIFYFLSICSQGKVCWGGNITHELQANNGCWGAEEALSVVAVLWFLSFLHARSDLTWRPAGPVETFITSSLNERC